MRIFITLLLLLLLSDPARGLTIAECGESNGMAWRFPSVVIPKVKPGWDDERVRDGKIWLIRDADGWDIIIKSGSGTYSARTGGASVVYGGGVNPYLFSVIYRNSTGPVIESYAFRFDDGDSGYVTWTQIRMTGVMDKMAVMNAPCVFANPKKTPR